MRFLHYLFYAYNKAKEFYIVALRFAQRIEAGGEGVQPPYSARRHYS